ncbi:MAG TPA: PQQ-dependent sugar dehydrogenase [Patescibacteria group bacterium]
MRKFALLLFFLIVGVGLVAYFNWDKIQSFFFQPRSSSLIKGTSLASLDPESSAAEISIIAENLDIPWEIEFLPSGDLLVTERSGQLVRLQADTRQSTPVEGVEHVGEGGLMGLALHPDYQNNNYLYLYLTTRTDQGLTNRVERYLYDEAANRLNNRHVIIENIPGAFVHDGGRIAFGPDGKLYITTGDAGTETNAQDTSSLAGKILRLNDDGSLPSDNSFQNPVYSYGHRNPQGLAWDDQGRLWATEHGPSGAGTGFDEVNLIEKGANYGWPTIQGDETREGMQSPIIHSGSQDTWAPGALEIVGNHLYFVGLRGQALYSAEINGSQLSNLTEHFKTEYGRLRVVKAGLDGFLYLATSNRDGRGDINPGDDKIIRVSPSFF